MHNIQCECQNLLKEILGPKTTEISVNHQLFYVLFYLKYLDF